MRRALKAAALVALLAAVAAAAPERSSRTNESITLDHKTTAKKKYELPVPAAGSRVRLRVKASVREGELKIVVRDAAGRLRHEAQLGPSKSEPTNYDVDSGEVRSAAGVWVIEVEAKAAVGSYEFTFTQNE
jgi:hypothetical protein